MPGCLNAARRTAIVSLGLAILVGCDNGQNSADKKVRKELSDAREIGQSGKEGAADQANALLSSAIQDASASSSARAAAYAAQAQADLQATLETMKAIQADEMSLSRVGWEISQLSEQIRTSLASAAGYQKYDPKAAQDAIATNIAQVQGGPDKATWLPADQASIPSLSAVKQNIAKLQGDVSQLQDQIKNLGDEQSKLLADAQQAADQADQLKGQKSVDVFTHASDLRRQAGEKSIAIDKLKVQLSRLQGDLDVANGQQLVLNETVDQFNQQSQQLAEGWKQIDGQVAQQKALSQEILNSASTSTTQPATLAGASLMQKVTEFDRLNKELTDLNGKAELSANQAVTNFENAYKAADQLRQELQPMTTDPKNQGRPELVAWKNILAVMEPMQFKLQQAIADRTLGGVYWSEAVSLARRISLRDTVNASFGSDFKVPDAIVGGDLTSDLNSKLSQADLAYQNSDKLLQEITDGSAPELLQANAHVNRILTLYAWAQIAKLQNNSQAAGDRIQQALSERGLAIDHNAQLPALPGELAIQPATAPTTQEGPATQAATGDEADARAAILAFVDAASKGDSAAAKDAATVEPGQEQYFDQFVTMMGSMKELSDAIKEKFPDQAKASPMQMNDMSAAFNNAKVTVKGDDAFVEGLPGATGPKKMATRTDGKWKFYFGAPTDMGDQMMQTMVQKMSGTLPQLTADLKAGKYATFEDFTKGMMEAMGMPGMPASQPAAQ